MERSHIIPWILLILTIVFAFSTFSLYGEMQELRAAAPAAIAEDCPAPDLEMLCQPQTISGTFSSSSGQSVTLSTSQGSQTITFTDQTTFFRELSRESILENPAEVNSFEALELSAGHSVTLVLERGQNVAVSIIRTVN